MPSWLWVVLGVGGVGLVAAFLWRRLFPSARVGSIGSDPGITHEAAEKEREKIRADADAKREEIRANHDAAREKVNDWLDAGKTDPR